MVVFVKVVWDCYVMVEEGIGQCFVLFYVGFVFWCYVVGRGQYLCDLGDGIGFVLCLCVQVDQFLVDGGGGGLG